MNELIIQWYSRSIFNFQPSEIKQLFRKIETKIQATHNKKSASKIYQHMFKRKLAANLYIIYMYIYIYNLLLLTITVVCFVFIEFLVQNI